MCQLLGMNCNVPTDIVFSFTGFHHRGGRTDQHADGWGIAFYEGRGCRLFLYTVSAATSPVAALVKSYPIRSLNVIAHIRKATVGSVALENTHPFQREMWGRYWTFAHNGTLKDFASCLEGERRYLPVGGTDSELAFCELLESLRRRFPEGRPARDVLFARCATRLAYIVRKAPFAKAHLLDEDYEVDFGLVTTPDDRVAVIATTPLTDNEAWTTIAPGSLLMFADGEPVAGAAAR